MFILPKNTGNLVRSRLAPTPSGFLHEGNLFNFALTWAIVRKSKGTLLLRIDDLDRERFRQVYLEDIFKTIEWMQIDYDEGPSGPDDFEASWSQCKRMDFYQEQLRKAIADPRFYACNCSRSTVRKIYPDGLYHGNCRMAGYPKDEEGYSLRLNVAEFEKVSWRDGINGLVEYNPAIDIGDFKVRKNNTFPSYHLTSTIDDEYFRINKIIRGEDLTGSTAAQLVLGEAMNFSIFTESGFMHHQLWKNPDGAKLSKSVGNQVNSIRSKYQSPELLFEKFGKMLKLEKISNAAEFLDAIPQKLITV